MEQQYLRSVRILFSAIFMGPIIFTGIVLFLQAEVNRTFTVEGDPFQYVAIIIGTSAVIASTILYRMRLPALKSLNQMDDKLQSWKILFIIRLAILEGAILFSVVCLLMQEADIYLYIAAGLTGVQALNFPIETTIKNDLNIS